MNAERLLAHFERISEAPNETARLRRFILDLAVRGKLVEQDPDEAPSAHNLDELRKQKDLAYSVEGLRARKPITAIRPTELWFNFPHSWMLCSFDDALVIVSGVTKGQRISSGETSVDVPYLRVANVQRGWLDLSEVKLIAVRASDVDRYRLANQDILMTEGGDWDKLGRAAIWRGEITCCIHQNHIFRLRIPSDSILPEWVVLYANSDCGRRFFEDSSKQTTNLASINLTQLRSCPIPLPPLAEQHRIVAKVDELMALCDQLEAARQQREQCRERLVAATLQRLNQPAEDPASFRKDASFALQVLPSLTTTPAQIKQLRQTILNLAVRGKLVEQDPEDEPAEELLAWIAADRKLLSSAKSRNQSASIHRLPIEANPYSLPCNWAWVRFGDIMYSRDGERVPVSKDERSRLAKNYDYYGASGVIDKIDGYLFDKPLLLIGEDGANLLNRSTPIAFIARGQYWVNNHAHVLDGISEEFLRFMELSINATDLSPYVTGTAQPKMNQAKMNSIPIALPPLAEQHRIVAKVDTLLALCDQLEQQLSQADQQRRRLLEAVLAEALLEPEKTLEAVYA
ncbi:restriction endonuclease subunit S [Vulcanococcus limneticus]|uniref:restriction endonuclease subunit S n=1 Tax=Vulcanococcus limneticus TaxID=2170428 RepID=UPI00398BE76D